MSSAPAIAPAPASSGALPEAKRHLRVLSNSEIRTFRTCIRKWFFAYVMLRRVRRTSDALRFGTLLHVALEAWWLAAKAGADPGARLAAAVEAIARHVGKTKTDSFEVVRAEELMLGYTARWAHEDIEVLAVETSFGVPLVNPKTGKESRTFSLAGKLDALVRIGGRFAVLEHKCLPASAEVYDHATGLYCRVGELAESGVGPTVTAMAAMGRRMVVARALAPVPASVRPICSIVTLGGRTLRASENHPVWTQRGWVGAGDVAVGDWVGTPRHMPSPRADADLPDEAIRLIGYMIGDGCMTNMSFTKTDRAALDDVLACAAALGERAVVRQYGEKAPIVQFSRVGIVAKLMVRAGLGGVGSADKRLPRHLALSDRQLGQLVGALWSTDGCIDSFGEKKLRIIYTSVSRELCQDIQHALQRLGVISNVRTTSVAYRGERRPVSTVQVITRASKGRFLSLAAEGVIPIVRSRVSIPDAARMVPHDSLYGSDARGQPALDLHVWWDRVESVALGPPEQTYDIEVPEHHTFVVDGIVTHNTTSQDLSVGARYWLRVSALDSQVSTYLAGARASGVDVDHCLYDVIRKVALRPKDATPVEARKYTKATAKEPVPRLYAGQRETDETVEEYRERVREAIAEAPERYFGRGEIVRLDEDDASHALDVWQTARLMREAALEERFPRNVDSCVSVYGECEYFAVCSREASIDDEVLYRTAETQHEELGVEEVRT